MAYIGKMNYLEIGGNTYEIEDKNAAPLDSPQLTGTPTAPTAAAGTSTTQIATTEFVQNAMSGAGAGTVTSVGVANATNGGLSVSGSPISSSGTITVGHSNVLSSAQTTQAVYPIKIDKNGHISSYGDAVTIPVNTDYQLQVSEVGNSSTYYPIVGNGTTAQTRQYDSSGFVYSATNGTTSSTGNATVTLGNNKSSTTANNKQGKIVLYGSTTYAHTIQGAPTAARTLTLPNASGTVALTSDIPTNVSSFLNDAGYLTSYTETDPTVPSWAKSSTKPTYTASEVSISNYLNWPTVQDAIDGLVSDITSIEESIPTKTSDLTNDSGYITGYTETDPTVPSWAKASTKPSYTASEVGAATSSHTHGNITNGGDITATAPTIANGDQIVINDNSASKITNGPTFDGSTTTTALTPKGTWETFSKFSGSYDDLTNKPTIPTVPTNVSAFTNDAGYVTSDNKVLQTEIDVNNRPNEMYSLLFSASDGSTTSTEGTKKINYLYYNPYDNELTLSGTGTISTTNIYGSTIVGNNFILNSGSPNYYDATITASGITAARTYTLPNKTGTIALRTDIPSVILNGTDSSMPTFYAPTTAGTSGYVLKSSGNGAPVWAEESGGSIVSYTPTLTSGTEIGTLTIDGTTSTLYGPTYSDAVLTPVRLDVVDAQAENVSISTTRMMRSGNTVSVMTEITLSAAMSDWTTIITGLPPTASGISHIWTEASWSTSYTRPLRCQVNNTGQIQIRYGAATIYRLNTTYICTSENSITNADTTSY